MVATDLPARLAELCQGLGWSQERLGAEVGRDRSAINAWMRGRRTPNIALLYALSGRHGWPREMWEEGGPRPGGIVSRHVRPADTRTPPAPVNRVQEALGHAFGRVAPYVRRGEPVPYQEVMEMLAALQAELEAARPRE